MTLDSRLNVFWELLNSKSQASMGTTGGEGKQRAVFTIQDDELTVGTSVAAPLFSFGNQIRGEVFFAFPCIRYIFGHFPIIVFECVLFQILNILL